MRRRDQARGADPVRVAADAPRLEVVARGPVTERHRDAFVVLRDGRADREPASVQLCHGDEQVVVGDEVELGIEVADGSYRLARVLPRRTVLERGDPSDPRGAARLTLAANVDLLVGVQPLSRLRPGLVDRLAVATAAAGIELLVCLHKVDLLADAPHDPGLLAAVAELEARCEGADVPLVRTTCGGAGQPPEVAALRDAIGTRCAVLVGPSGAGKSSLANALVPGLAREVREVRDADGKGRHTTSSSAWFPLPGGGALIDTPGVRAFGLEAPDAATLAAAYPDITAVAAGCRFRDCRHGTEPDCAVRRAVGQGTLSAARVATWQRLTGADPAAT